MKRALLGAGAALLIGLLLFVLGCTAPPKPEEPDPEGEKPAITEPEHSSLYVPGVNVEDVILYFNEVCLDSEFINSGDPSRVQKWMTPIYYRLEGNYHEQDVAVLNSFAAWLNDIEGFPGLFPTEDLGKRNLWIYFCDRQRMIDLMGPDFTDMDGAVTFWYTNDEIYDEIICYREDMDQDLRNSVILEEIYNGLGPIQDTTMRPDSIIYQEFAQNQWLSSVDELLLRLLYHPEIRPGMTAQECEQVIRRLYY